MSELAPTSSRRPLAAVAALSATAFCFGTTENLPIGLLGLIGDSLHASAARTGLLVTAYGLVVAVVSVPLARVTARFPRRPLLLTLSAVFAVASLASALATTYGALLAARTVTALAHALFWAVAPVAAATLFPPDKRGRASSIVMAGGSLAILIGVPVGTWLGHETSWRWSFAGLSVVTTLAFCALAALLPKAAAEEDQARAPAPDRRVYVRLVAMIALTITGFFTFFTYVTVYLTETAGFAETSVSPILLAYGLCDVVGLVTAAALADRHTRPVLYLSLIVLAVSQAALGVPAAGNTLVLVAMAAFALALPGVVCAMQTLMLRHAPGDLSVASAGTSAAFNAGVALGALLGSALLTTASPRHLPPIAAAFSLAALACVGRRLR